LSGWLPFYFFKSKSWRLLIDMQILSRIAAIFGIISLGVIITEVINNTTWLPIRLQPVQIVIPAISFYLLYEAIIRVIRQKADRGEHASRAVRLLLRTTRSIYLILGIIALLSIPLLWWGVIKRLAAQAGEGKLF
jgi:hypothetical protein